MSFLTPWILGLSVPVIGGLILVYRTYGSGERHVLGSLMILRELEEKRILRQRFMPPLRFFIELLIFLAMLFLLAGFFFDGSTNRALLIVDTSESMEARNAEGKTRLLRSQEYVSSWLELLPSDASVDIYQTSPRPTRLNDSGVSPSSAASLIEDLKTADAEGDLKGAFKLALGAHEYSRILVVTDQSVEIGELQDGVEAEVYTVSIENKNNISLISSQMIEGEIELELRNFSEKEMDAAVTLHSIERRGGEITLLPARRTRTTVLAEGTERITFKNIYEDTLVAQIESEGDALTSDNWRVVGSGSGDLQMSIYSPKSLDALSLPTFPGVQFVSSTPELSPAITLIHRQPTLKKLQQLPSLEVLAVDGGKRKSRVGGKIVRSAENHPLLDYVDLTQLEFPSVIPLKTPPWAESILEVESGTIVYAGYRDGNPVVAFGFELFPLSGSDTPLQSILFLNSVKWIKSGIELRNRTQHVPGGKWSEFNPSIATSYFSFENQSLTLLKSASLPGKRGFISHEDQILGVNFWSSRESNLLNSGYTRITFQDEEIVPESKIDQGYFPPLLFFLLLLLVSDLLLIAFRKRYAIS